MGIAVRDLVSILCYTGREFDIEKPSTVTHVQNIYHSSISPSRDAMSCRFLSEHFSTVTHVFFNMLCECLSDSI